MPPDRGPMARNAAVGWHFWLRDAPVAYEDDQVSEKLCLVVSLKLDGVDFIP
jgi:hypothetical protein